MGTHAPTFYDEQEEIFASPRNITYVDEMVQRGDIDEITCKLGNFVYDAVCRIFESLEHHDMIYGNSHHATQKIADYAKEEVLARIKKNNYENNIG
jgi:hypothetical protein